MSEATALETTEITHIPLERITPNPYQPRRIFDKTALSELAQSIKEFGVMQPVCVRLIAPGKFELVAGERRLRASRLAGLEVIPAIVVNLNDRDSASIALIENLQRENLHYIEQAEGFQNLINDYGFTQERLSERIGKNQSTIANKLRILKLSKNVQRILIDSGLTERHARALLRLETEEEQLVVLERINRDGLNVKKTEEFIEAFLEHREKEEKAERAKNAPKPRGFARDMRLLTNTIEHTVEQLRQTGLNADYTVEQHESEYRISISVKLSS